MQQPEKDDPSKIDFVVFRTSFGKEGSISLPSPKTGENWDNPDWSISCFNYFVIQQYRCVQVYQQFGFSKGCHYMPHIHVLVDVL